MAPHMCNEFGYCDHPSHGLLGEQYFEEEQFDRNLPAILYPSLGELASLDDLAFLAEHGHQDLDENNEAEDDGYESDITATTVEIQDMEGFDQSDDESEEDSADGINVAEFPVDEEGHRIYRSTHPIEYNFWADTGIEMWRAMFADVPSSENEESEDEASEILLTRQDAIQCLNRAINNPNTVEDDDENQDDEDEDDEDDGEWVEQPEDLIEPFPENLEIKNGNYSKECKIIYEKLWEEAAYEGTATDERLHTVLYQLKWEENEEEGIFRPECTDDVEKTIFRLFDDLAFASSWHGHTHETYLQSLEESQEPQEPQQQQ